MASAFLLATLGSEPQVVTIALQTLLEQGIPVETTIVIHTSESSPAIGRALDDVRRAFASPPFENVRLEFHAITQNGIPLRDIATQDEAQATFGDLYRLVKELKRQGHQIHFSIAGGRKIMALYGLAVAQLLCDPQDSLYYLFSESDLIRERRLLLEPEDRAQLVRIPFLRWTNDTALIADIQRFDDPLQAMGRGAELARIEEQRRWEVFCQHVLGRAEEAIVALIVREGLTNAQLAQRLCRSPKTIANQLTSIYVKLHDYLGERASGGVDRHTLIVHLHGYYQRRQP